MNKSQASLLLVLVGLTGIFGCSPSIKSDCKLLAKVDDLNPDKQALLDTYKGLKLKTKDGKTFRDRVVANLNNQRLLAEAQKTAEAKGGFATEQERLDHGLALVGTIDEASKIIEDRKTLCGI